MDGRVSGRSAVGRAPASEHYGPRCENERQGFRRLEELFHELSGLSAEARLRRLESLRREEPEIYSKLGPILALETGDGLLGGAESEVSTGRALEPFPRTVGPYRLLRELGSGGMGVVYEAEQSEPVERRVAIKLIRAGLNSARILERFTNERQALAVMDHPSIARVFDAGEAEDGRPYFVMELVDGLPITDYCDAHRRSTSRRLELFLEVCEAVQHAHRKGVIHRDLKPSNILVTEVEGRPLVKIIDFGIAKATQDEGGDLLTRVGELVGTPEYMSPEQAVGIDVDTRSDVFSLGTVLFELLVGELPLPAEKLRQAANEEIRRRLQEGETPRPTERLTALGERATAVAAQRDTNVASLARRVQGDLDWIVLKALAKNRAERYGAVSELADDVGRHLRDEPVSAGPPSLSYRLRKLYRRQRLLVGAATFVLLALLFGVVGTSLALVRATRAESQARAQAQRARLVTEFLEDLLESADPKAEGEPTLDDLLGRAAEQIGSELESEPEVKAELLTILGSAYSSLSEFGRADALSEQAVTVAEGAAVTDPHVLGRALQSRSTVLVHLGRLEEAERVARAALDIARRGDASSDSHASALMTLGEALSDQGRNEEAAAAYREALALLSEQGETVAQAHLRIDLSSVLHSMGQLDEGREVALRAVRFFRNQEPSRRLSLATAAGNLGVIEMAAGQLDRAAELFVEQASIVEDVLGAGHADMVTPLGNLGAVEYRRGDFEAAARAFDQTLEIIAARYGRAHSLYARVLAMKANAYQEGGRVEEGWQLQFEALEILEESLGERHAEVAMVWGNMADTALNEGRRDVALDYARKSIEIFQGLEEPHLFLGAALSNYARALESSDPEEARAQHSSSLRAFERQSLEGTTEEATAQAAFARFLLDVDEPAQALELAERSLATLLAIVPADHPSLSPAEALVEQSRRALSASQ